MGYIIKLRMRIVKRYSTLKMRKMKKMKRMKEEIVISRIYLKIYIYTTMIVERRDSLRRR